ncbi:MAG: hypothetical protein H7Y11_01630, partial [Armatimonadetes bacterium]|nr:hypothetical protein [Anaerolineae bacterium]
MLKFGKMLLMVLVAGVIAACGGGAAGTSGGGNTPEGAAKAFMEGFGALDATKMTAELCAAQSAQADGLSAGFESMGTDVTIDVSGVTYGTPVITGDTANVPLSGNIKIEVPSLGAQGTQDLPVSTFFTEGLAMVK